jgi:hypothetical protein
MFSGRFRPDDSCGAAERMDGQHRQPASDCDLTGDERGPCARHQQHAVYTFHRRESDRTAPPTSRIDPLLTQTDISRRFRVTDAVGA